MGGENSTTMTGDYWKTTDKSDTAHAIRYALKNWGGLTTFLEDGRVERKRRPGTLREPG